MDEAFIYLIKVNIALVVFYLFYRLLFSQDTFFVIRRFCLWMSPLGHWMQLPG